MKNTIIKPVNRNVAAIILAVTGAFACPLLQAQTSVTVPDTSEERQRQIKEHQDAIRDLEQRETYEEARTNALDKIRNIQRLQQQIQDKKDGKTTPVTGTKDTSAVTPRVTHDTTKTPKDKSGKTVQKPSAKAPAKSPAKGPTNPQAKKQAKKQAKPAPALSPVVLVASSIPQPGKIRYVVQNKRRYLNLADIATRYRMGYRFNGSTAVIYSQNHYIVLKSTKRECSIDKTNVTLLFPVIGTSTAFYMSELDYFNVFEPALNEKMPFHKVMVIMLDPGHGGTDQGAPGPVLPEKTINLRIALELCSKLKALGFQVYMTRSGDTTVSLQQRSDMCKKLKPDLYISIHCNASTNRAISGVESWAVAPCGGQSAQENTVKTTFDPGNKFDKHNFRLAWEIQRAMQKIFPNRIDRGVKHSRFFVLRNASAPSVLLEVGFLSYYAEGKILATADEQTKIVNAILTGLAGYINAMR